MYTYVSKLFADYPYYAGELHHQCIGIILECLLKTTSPANVKDYLSRIIGKDIK